MSEVVNNEPTLEERVATLEATLVESNNTIMMLQRQIVEVTAAHIERIFQDQVMVDSLAQRFMVAAANAIAFKAKASRQKAPELMVLEGYLPGAIRVTLEEGGARIEMEAEGQPGVWKGGADLPAQMQDAATVAVFGDLLISYGAEIGRTYFVMERNDVEEARAKAQSAALAITGVEVPADEEAQA